MNSENQKKQIHLVAAARPNFMKIAPLYHALKNQSWAHPVIVHTGQHYDLNMSDIFFQNLGLPSPDLHLGVGGGTHAEQTGQVMIAYERALVNTRPDLVVVVGDVNSTVAASIAAVKLGIKVAHLEAGLRSFDRTMPEEINRVITDSIADMLWTPSADGDENLIREGISRDKIRRVGNIMIDSLELLRDQIRKESVYEAYGFSKNGYGVVTFHRPSNVDNPLLLKNICEILGRVSKQIPLIFPLHPRTRNNLEKNGLMKTLTRFPDLLIAEPLSYIKFMNLIFNCRLVITDSGGIQEETSYLGIPCLTMRPNTERPVTITLGTNRLCNPENLEVRIQTVLCDGKTQKTDIDLWDGKTALRVVDSIREMAFQR
ncbi:MAG: UDP-N-acetylglucosamine 2-epimerase (non-hydrolyzing) [Desulfobacterales bacterium]|nr:UDP-N-acetylglucosamine 2-epimerase (non-hydrolyzing) [Desulfobacterales bacterium]MDD4392710.1 UDP-N-acetylglucosamine 2-epimerase (non-hydrolyzing) [Desulfobacterales bacterium]